MNALDVLVGARKQLTEKGWTRGAFARDIDGYPVASTRKTAVCYCLSGAIRSLADDAGNWIAARALVEEAQGESYLSITELNDGSSNLEGILTVLDKAIELAKEQVGK
jgi:hypothetical protein